MKKILMLVSIVGILYAWNGYDYDTGEHIEIGEGNLVRSGSVIEYYDDEDGEYKNAEVQSIEDRGNSVDVEILDENTGEIRTFEMDK
jgi:hypothetical protein